MPSHRLFAAFGSTKPHILFGQTTPLPNRQSLTHVFDHQIQGAVRKLNTVCEGRMPIKRHITAIGTRDERLPRARVGETNVFLALLTEVHPLDQPQDIRRGQDDAAGRHDRNRIRPREHRARPERPQEHPYFTYEPAKSRQTSAAKSLSRPACRISAL